MSVSEQQLVQLLGALTGPGAGIGGAALAPDQKALTGLSSGAGGLGGAIGGGALGSLAGGGLGMLGGAGAGSLMGLEGEELKQLIALLGGLGGGAGLTAGGMLGGGMGAGAGYQAVQGYPEQQPSGPPPQQQQQQEKEGSAMSVQTIHAIGYGALEKLAERGVDPVCFVQAAANSNNDAMRKTASAIIAYDQAVRQQREKQAADGAQSVYAFGYGALEKLAEQNIDPANFVQAAANSNNDMMRKTASAILQYAQAAQGREKQAAPAAAARAGEGLLSRGANLIPGMRQARQGRSHMQQGQTQIQQGQAQAQQARNLQDSALETAATMPQGNPGAYQQLKPVLQRNYDEGVAGAAAGQDLLSAGRGQALVGGAKLTGTGAAAGAAGYGGYRMMGGGEPEPDPTTLQQLRGMFPYG